MAKTNFSLQLITLADYLITGDDKKMSIIGMFDKIFVKELPAMHRQMWLAMTFAGAVKEKEKIHLSVLNPSGKEELQTDMEIGIGENGKANVTVNFEGFPVNETGQFQIIITKGKEELGIFTFEAILLKESATEKKIAN